MSVIFIDGFDFYQTNGFSGGRKWDQGSVCFFVGGRFGGQGIGLTGYTPTGAYFNSMYMKKTLATPVTGIIVGFAFVTGSVAGVGRPLLTFLGSSLVGGVPSGGSNVATDGSAVSPTLAQLSLWVDSVSGSFQIRTGMGTETGSLVLQTGTFVIPLTLWVYVEIYVEISSTNGLVQVQVDGQNVINYVGPTQSLTGNSTSNINSFVLISPQEGLGPSWTIDDLYVINPNDGIGSTSFLGEVRVQTKYPDAEGYEDDFYPSSGTNNAANVNTAITQYNETGIYNYSGSVGAIDLYSVANFTVSGQIFAVQENLSVRKDDVGNRDICPLLRTGSQNFQGSSVPLYSTYTYAGKIWELNPDPTQAIDGELAPWNLTTLNQAEFGLQITSTVTTNLSAYLYGVAAGGKVGGVTA